MCVCVFVYTSGSQPFFINGPAAAAVASLFLVGIKAAEGGVSYIHGCNFILHYKKWKTQLISAEFEIGVLAG